MGCSVKLRKDKFLSTEKGVLKAKKKKDRDIRGRRRKHGWKRRVDKERLEG